jgi:hypothetical protein
MLENTGGLVYGTLIIGALLDAESTASETYAETVGAVLTALLLVWLAHSYADYVGERVQHGLKLRPGELTHGLLRGLSVVVGGAIPIATLMLCWIAGASLATAVNVGIYTSAGMLLVIEFSAGWRADVKGVTLLVQSVVGATLGALIIALKLILH